MSPYKLLLKWRRFLQETPWFKKCFKCNNVYPLFIFEKNNSRFQLPSAKGKCFECRICGIKRKFGFNK